ncbi:MAG: hypothetical protein ACFFCI_06570 [Promethearchaeota archaeon]
MTKKKLPPPPKFPPSFIIDENFCLLHKGDIQGEIYTCRVCKTKYCLKCAQKAEKEALLCVKCKHLILI